jgi:beta-glucan synthesis-associated protein KRE6
MSGDGPPVGPRRPTHITVNSGSGGNLLELMHSDSSQSSVPNTSRPLLTPSRPGTGMPSRPPGGPTLYGAPGQAPSAEMLLPPARARGPRRYQDISADQFRPDSVMSSRRTSFGSDGDRSRDSKVFASPFDDSRAPSRAESSDDENVNTQTVSDKYNIMPSAGLLLYPEDVEKDDWLHNPDPNEPERDKCNIFTKRGLVNVGGLAFITLGILVLFVGYPIMYVPPLLMIVSFFLNTDALQNLCTKICNKSTIDLCNKFALSHRQDAPPQKSAYGPYRSRYATICHDQNVTRWKNIEASGMHR